MAQGADYAIIVADLLTGVARDEIPFDTFTWGRQLNAAGSFSGTIGVYHQKATEENLDPGRTAIYVLRNGVCVWSGILWTALPDIGQQNQLQVGGEGLWSYFAGAGGQTSQGRFVKADLEYDAVDQLAVAQALIAWAQAQPGGNINVQIGTETSGVFTSQLYQAANRPNIGTLIKTLSQQVGGFDYSIDTDFSSGAPISTLHLWYPMQGRRDSELVLELGTNILTIQPQTDSTIQANSVDMVGSDGSIGSDQDTSVLGAYPLLETVQQAPSTVVAGDLAGGATSYLAAVDMPVKTIQNLQAQVTSDFAPGVYSMGDWVQVIARAGYMNVNGAFRITADQVSVDAQGSEQVGLTFASAGTFV